MNMDPSSVDVDVVYVPLIMPRAYVSFVRVLDLGNYTHEHKFSTTHYFAMCRIRRIDVHLHVV